MNTKTCHGVNSVCEVKEQPAENFSPVGGGRTRNLCKECVNKIAQKKRDDEKKVKVKKRERVSYKKDVTVFGDAAQEMFGRKLA